MCNDKMNIANHFGNHLRLFFTMPIISSTLNHFEYKLRVAFKLPNFICNYVVHKYDTFSVIVIWVCTDLLLPHCT